MMYKQTPDKPHGGALSKEPLMLASYLTVIKLGSVIHEGHSQDFNVKIFLNCYAISFYQFFSPMQVDDV